MAQDDEICGRFDAVFPAVAAGRIVRRSSSAGGGLRRRVGDRHHCTGNPGVEEPVWPDTGAARPVPRGPEEARSAVRRGRGRCVVPGPERRARRLGRRGAVPVGVPQVRRFSQRRAGHGRRRGLLAGLQALRGEVQGEVHRVLPAAEGQGRERHRAQLLHEASARPALPAAQHDLLPFVPRREPLHPVDPRRGERAGRLSRHHGLRGEDAAGRRDEAERRVGPLWLAGARREAARHAHNHAGQELQGEEYPNLRHHAGRPAEDGEVRRRRYHGFPRRRGEGTLRGARVAYRALDRPVPL